MFPDLAGESRRRRPDPAGGASTEEILLELKRLATNYSARLEMGISYRFGSMYSNVVNPRFGNR